MIKPLWRSPRNPARLALLPAGITSNMRLCEVAFTSCSGMNAPWNCSDVKTIAMTGCLPDLAAEWLEADGLGGFASGTVGGFRTRRYHALLLTARQPPTGRLVLVNGLEAEVETETATYALSTQHYAPNVFHPDGSTRLESFTIEPWPVWRWRLADGTVIELELFVPHECSAVVLSWKRVAGTGHGFLRARPLLSGRDYHALQHENPACNFTAVEHGDSLAWQTYPGLPAVHVRFNGVYRVEPEWYRQFLYSIDQERGLDHVEDLAAPGVFTWDLAQSEPAILMFAAEGHESLLRRDHESVASAWARIRSDEGKRRGHFPSMLHRAADAYIVRRGSGKTVVAGYPWFTDWGRDTFIALRGLCLATGRLEDAGDMLTAWAGTVSEGMLPNRFPDYGDQAEYNSVDASLWFVIAVHDYFLAMRSAGQMVSLSQADLLWQAVEAILTGYSRGTRFGIRLDSDGLLAAGMPGVQLTWMDAKIGDWVVMPRTGKPVEIQALWLNALAIAAEHSPQWRPLWERGRAAFQTRFWLPGGRGLFDVIDVDHRRGKNDATLRPNQIFAVGGLPYSFVDRELARQIVDLVEARLLTPLGLRSAAPASKHYAAHYLGGVSERDGAYHQGTVWPWLMGPFVEAWVRVRGNTSEAKQQARERFLPGLTAHLHAYGLGHISEIADAEPPHTPRGCPFQAWSLGEFLRLELQVLSDTASPPVFGSAQG